MRAMVVAVIALLFVPTVGLAPAQATHPTCAFIVGGSGSDTLTGGPGCDHIYGRGGSDTINGLGGDDILEGADGNDIIFGGPGNDTVMGGHNCPPPLQEIEIILLGALPAMLDPVATAVLVVACITLETVIALPAEQGNDIIDGGTGSDSIEGGLGNDSITGGAGDDFIDGDWFQNPIDPRIPVALIPFPADGNDSIDGGTGDDTIRGDGGNDGITGGAGNDSMDGGGGSDSCQFDPADAVAPTDCEAVF